MTAPDRPLLIVQAKAPSPGRVRTRMSPPLTPEQAARVHAAFVSDIVETLMGFAWCADVELQTDEDTTAWDRLEVKRSLEPSGDPGDRLLTTIDNALSVGRGKVAIFGADSPSLPRAHVAVLLDSHADVVFGPCEDGGFYGMSCRRMHPEMFAGVRWSAPSALDDAIRAARACGLSVALGVPWFSVRTATDLMRLNSYLPPRRTRQLLKQLSLIPRKQSSNPSRTSGNRSIPTQSPR